MNARPALGDSFELMGSRFNIVLDPKLMTKKKSIGFVDADALKMFLWSDPKKTIMPDRVLHTYFHELVHLILDMMGERELYENERFVDVFGGLLHQWFTSQEGQLEFNFDR